MEDNKLWKNRVLPTLNDMYVVSQTIFDTEAPKPHIYRFSWDDIKQFAPTLPAKLSVSKGRTVPLNAFCINEDDYNYLSKRAVKGLRKYWRWPYRFEIVYTDEMISEMTQHLEKLKSEYIANPDSGLKFDIDDLEEKISKNSINIEHNVLWDEYLNKLESLEDRLNAKEISRKEYNKLHTELCKSYNMRQRSMDAEKVWWCLLDYAPNANPLTFGKVRMMYNKLKEKMGTDTCVDAELVSTAAEEIFDGEHKGYITDVVSAYLFFANYKTCKNIK